MATIAHYIYSHYDPPKPQQEETQASQDYTHLVVDPWQTESTFGAQTRLARTPQFVPAVVSYDEINDLIGSREVAAQRNAVEGDQKDDVSGWYRSLIRGRSLPPSTTSTATSTTLSSGSRTPLDAGPSDQGANKRKPAVTKNDWFIRRALLNGPSSTSALATPSRTLADILSREPPALSKEDALRPPVFLAIGPSNRGFTMLENSGWREGEALGPHAHRRKSAGTMDLQENKRFKRGTRGPLIRQEQREIACGSDDEVSEVKKVDVVDLTLSDSDGEDIGSELVLTSRPASAGPTLSHPHDGTALLTPIPTILKSDRLGIGLKAKTEGPYRVSKKRVTHNQAALAAHIRATEELKRKKKLTGRGSRAFARAAKAEADGRRQLLASLNDSLA